MSTEDNQLPKRNVALNKFAETHFKLKQSEERIDDNLWDIYQLIFSSQYQKPTKPQRDFTPREYYFEQILPAQLDTHKVTEMSFQGYTMKFEFFGAFRVDNESALVKLIQLTKDVDDQAVYIKEMLDVAREDFLPYQLLGNHFAVRLEGEPNWENSVVDLSDFNKSPRFRPAMAAAQKLVESLFVKAGVAKADLTALSVEDFRAKYRNEIDSVSETIRLGWQLRENLYVALKQVDGNLSKYQDLAKIKTESTAELDELGMAVARAGAAAA